MPEYTYVACVRACVRACVCTYYMQGKVGGDSAPSIHHTLAKRGASFRQAIDLLSEAGSNYALLATALQATTTTMRCERKGKVLAE